ncbi:hypothetical protein B0H11DRAFT_2375370 [Mycena galericulata]|nr:hypothetical protein B0H11DRAFT_2375370 [Mycena galericulata]
MDPHHVTPGLGLNDPALLQDLLRSHSALEPDHLVDLALLLSSLSTQLARYDEEAIEYRGGGSLLLADRAALQRRYDDLRSLLAPIRHLPSEILGEIFALMTSDLDKYPNRMDRLGRRPLLKLAQVCARWRMIVLGTPSFWSTIHFYSYVLESIHSRGLLQSALDRAGDSPLTVFITRDNALTPQASALELLLQSSQLWKTASLSCSTSELYHFLSLKWRLPSLETLTLDVSDFTRRKCPPDVASIFQVAPRLKNVVIVRRLPSGILLPPFSQLRGLKLTEMDVWDLIPSLALLHIIDNLTLTHLHELELRCEKYPYLRVAWPHEAFLSLSARSAFHSHLHSLSLCDVRITEARLLECLSVLPALQKLELGDRPHIRRFESDPPLVTAPLITNNLLHALARTPEAPCLVPRLHTLRMCTSLRFNDKAYLELLLSRVEPRRVFTAEISPHLEQYRELDPAVRARLRELQTQGNLVFAFSAPLSFS